MSAEYTRIEGTEFGAKFVVCSKAEILGVSDKEAANKVSRAAAAVIEAAGFNCEYNSTFRDWEGGRIAQFATVKGSPVAAYIFSCELDEDGDETGEFKYVEKSKIPADVIAKVQAIVDAADQAAQARIDEITSAAFNTHQRFGVVIEVAGANYSAYVPELPGCTSTGATLVEVAQNIQGAIDLHLEGLAEDSAKAIQP